MLFERFTVIPSIDLKDGAVVRLVRGEMRQATVYGEDPAAVALGFEREGARVIHVVDLDGAVAGKPVNLASVRAIRAAVGCALDVSGGLRSREAVEEAIGAGAHYISLGSAAALNPELLEEVCRSFPGRVFGSLDVRGGRLAIRGWLETSALEIDEAARRFIKAGVAALILTDVSRDGTEAGADVEMFSAVAVKAGVPVIASGGVATVEDIRSLRCLFPSGVAGVIVGRALYEGRFTLAEALTAAL